MPPLHPTTTPIYAALLTLLILALGYYITRLRGSEGVSLGTGKSTKLEQTVRAHANAVENVPLALLLLLIFELQGAPSWTLHAAGALLVLARILHAKGLMAARGRSFGRFWGTALTWTCMAALCAGNLFYALG